MNKKVICLLFVSFFLLSTSQGKALEKEERLWQDETIYYLMVDRFYNGSSENNYNVDVLDKSAYHGGDFAGISNKLDYIKEMGFTTIVLSPIFDNSQQSYLGDMVTDYYQTEKHFGSLEEFKQLVKTAHEKELKVIMEFVVDSISKEHVWANDDTKKEYYVENDRLLELNLANEDVSDYLIEVAKWWITETAVDGYYFEDIDVAASSFWRHFTTEIKVQDEDFFLIGKASSGELKDYDGIGLDSLVDTSLMPLLRTSFAKQDGSLEDSIHQIETNIQTFQHPELLSTLLDDKTSTRFTYEMDASKDNPGTRWKVALSYLYTTPGIPFVFYGSEIALNGGGMPDNHRLLGFKADQELIDYIKLLGGLRQQLPSLTRGTFEVLYEEQDFVLYKRQYESETIVVAVNNSSRTRHVTLSNESLKENGELRGLLAGDLVRENDSEYSFVIDREHAEIYALTEKTGINFTYILAIIMIWVVFSIFIIVVMKRSGKRKIE